MISPVTIECEEIRQNLLQEIAHLWITTRGHSKARKIKENYKVAKGKSVKGKHSLRKELHKTSSIQSNGIINVWMFLMKSNFTTILLIDMNTAAVYTMTLMILL